MGWTQAELKTLDRKTKKIIMNRALHPRSNIDTLLTKENVQRCKYSQMVEEEEKHWPTRKTK